MDVLRKDRDQDVTIAPALSGGSGGENVTTILGGDTEFNGTLKFKSSLRIEGKFEGEMESEGQLIVAKSGEVKAEIKVGGLVVEGRINGNITASDLVDLRSSAEVQGDITAARLKIEDGVIFVGRADVKPSGKRANANANEPRPPQADPNRPKDQVKRDGKEAAAS